MNVLLKKIYDLPGNHLIILASFVAALIASQINYIQHGWINNDSVIYFESARLFAAGAWQEGYSIFKWPLYSSLIAAMHVLTGFSIHLSAQILNVVFFSIATASFLKIIQQSGGNNKVILLGCLILFSSQYVVGGALKMLLRDQGFWAFVLTSLLFLIQFHQTQKIRFALLWQLSAIIATLFRIEAISFLMCLPFIIFITKGSPFKDRAYAFIQCHIVNIIIAGALTLTLIFSDSLNLEGLGRLKEVFTLNLYQELTENLVKRSKIMSSEVLGMYLDEFATVGILITFVVVVITKIITSTGLITTIFGMLGTRSKHTSIHPVSKQILIATMIIAVINMFLIITKVFVLSGRYVIAMSFMLMIFTAFFLADNFQRPSSSFKWKKWALVLLIVMMTAGILKNIWPKRDGYNYQQEAVAWLNQKNLHHLPVFFDDSRIRHYAGLPFIGTWQDNKRIFMQAVENKTIQRYKFLILSQDKADIRFTTYIANNIPEFKPVHSTMNTKGNRLIVIYQRRY